MKILLFIAFAGHAHAYSQLENLLFTPIAEHPFQGVNFDRTKEITVIDNDFPPPTPKEQIL